MKSKHKISVYYNLVYKSVGNSGSGMKNSTMNSNDITEMLKDIRHEK